MSRDSEVKGVKGAPILLRRPAARWRPAMEDLISISLVLEDAPDASKLVLPVYLLSFGVGPPGIANADLVDPAQHPCGQCK